MTNGKRDWDKKDEKRDAILAFMKYIIKNREQYQEGTECVGNDKKAHALFEDQNIGNTAIPQKGRVVVFDPGENKLEAASSLIIELPPDNVVGKEMTDDQLLTYVLGNYDHWSG